MIYKVMKGKDVLGLIVGFQDAVEFCMAHRGSFVENIGTHKVFFPCQK